MQGPLPSARVGNGLAVASTPGHLRQGLSYRVHEPLEQSRQVASARGPGLI